MKKTIIILLALACLMLVGCSNKPEDDQQPQQKEVTIRVIAYGDDGFIISNKSYYYIWEGQDEKTT